MDLGGFHARVSQSMRVGTSMDGVIPSLTEEAAQFIERNYTFQYMRRQLKFDVNPASDNPHVLSIYNTPLKKLVGLKKVVPDAEQKANIGTPLGRLVDLHVVAPEDLHERKLGPPERYYLDGVSAIIVDPIPFEAVRIELIGVFFSVWQPAQAAFRHYLIDHFRPLLLARTLMYAAVDRRDSRLYEIYKQQFLDSQTAVNVSEEDLLYGGAESNNQMIWSPEMFNFDEEFNTRKPGAN